MSSSKLGTQHFQAESQEPCWQSLPGAGRGQCHCCRGQQGVHLDLHHSRSTRWNQNPSGCSSLYRPLQTSSSSVQCPRAAARLKSRFPSSYTAHLAAAYTAICCRLPACVHIPASADHNSDTCFKQSELFACNFPLMLK